MTTDAMQQYFTEMYGEHETDTPEPTGYMRPCDGCDGTGMVTHPWMPQYKGFCPCCDGTGIYDEEWESYDIAERTS